MSLYVLDTDILSLLQRVHPKLASRCAARHLGELAITMISGGEQLVGRYTRIHKARRPDHLAAA